ncbi:MAG: hypothetical protein IPH62_04595 [Ignavibacteriae bacterium]|nr:hypothetical protein [Ignavibacteriota bacterium]
MKSTKVRFMTFTLITLFAISIFYVNSCDDGPTEPKIEPGRRDYVWEIDTLKVPYGEFTSAYGIWGTDPNNIWMTAGRSSSNQYRLFHFNGIKWENIDIEFSLLDAWSIYGFDSKNIWICTGLGKIIKYNGSNWELLGNYAIEGEQLALNGFSGNSISEFYSFGAYLESPKRSKSKAILLKNNITNNDWEYVDFGEINTIFSSMTYDSNEKCFFISSYNPSNGHQNIYKFANNKITDIYESNEETKVFGMENTAYFMVGKKILKYKNGSLFVWEDFSDIEGFAGPILGRNEKDFFTATFGVGIGHYNGSYIEILFETDLWFSSSIIFENEVFFVCFRPGIKQDIIIHGKLETK